MALLHLINHQQRNHEDHGNRDHTIISTHPQPSSFASPSFDVTSLSSTAMLRLCLIELRHVKFLLQKILNQQQCFNIDDNDVRNSPLDSDVDIKRLFSYLVLTRLEQVTVRFSDIHKILFLASRSFKH